MDYITKPVTRNQLRKYAREFREKYGVSLTGQFPVLEALEKFPDLYPGSYYSIVEDDELPVNTPAKCFLLETGGFEIQIRRVIYDGAYRNIGAFRDHILHELCHVFLYCLGYIPETEHIFKSGELINYCSSEWQAKALCGEIMMPYEETEQLTSAEIALKYGVSLSQARYRLKY